MTTTNGQVADIVEGVVETANERGIKVAAMLALLSLQVLRTFEIWRSNVDDVQRRNDQRALLVRGKGHDRLIYLRGDVGEGVVCYLDARDDVPPDVRGVPLVTAVANRAGGARLSRRGLRKIVDGYLSELDLKRPGGSNHALRHAGLQVHLRSARRPGSARPRRARSNHAAVSGQSLLTGTCLGHSPARV